MQVHLIWWKKLLMRKGRCSYAQTFRTSEQPINDTWSHHCHVHVRPSHDCFCAYAAASRRSSLTTAAKASGLTPCSHKATRMASVWRSKPVPSTSDMRCTRSSDSLALCNATPSISPPPFSISLSRSRATFSSPALASPSLLPLSRLYCACRFQGTRRTDS